MSFLGDLGFPRETSAFSDFFGDDSAVYRLVGTRNSTSSTTAHPVLLLNKVVMAAGLLGEVTGLTRSLSHTDSNLP